MEKLNRTLFLCTLSACVVALSLFLPAPSGTTEEARQKTLLYTGPFNASAEAVPPEFDPRRYDEVKKLLRRGEYERAKQLVEEFFQQNPNDPWILAYRSLFEQRSRSEYAFEQLEPEELQALKDRLDQESHSQNRSAAIQKAVDHQIEKEQAAWARELEKKHRVSEGELRKQQAVQARQDKEQGRAVKIQAKTTKAATAATVSAAEAPAAAPAEQPYLEQAAAPKAAEAVSSQVLAPSAAGSVELAPVVVPTERSTQEVNLVTSPSLVGQTLPIKGAVQINARQMSVSPDQRIAIADGDVEIVFENAILTCDHATLFTDTKDVYAEGNVRVEEGLQVFRGEAAHYNFENKKGRFLQGTISSPPWHEHGRSVEHIAEGVYEVTPGYLTTCELEPPHFKLAGTRAVFFADEKLTKISNVAFFVEKLPFLYLPYISFADRQMPFFFIPGKKKPWEEFVLMGYRYKLPIDGNHKGTVKLDWRRAFLWGMGVDHQLDSPSIGKGLFKFYYNDTRYIRRPKSDLVKGADSKRYRVLWRHKWNPMPDTTVLTDIQKYSDIDFRKEFLFREEYTGDDATESFISVVTNDPNYTLTGLVKKRINRFQSIQNTLPQLTADVRSQRIGESYLFSESKLDFANFENKTAHSDSDTDAVRLDWFQQFKYAMRLFRPLEVTPKAGIRQTYYNKDRQGSNREKGDRDIISGQWNTGMDASLKLFRIFPVKTNFLGMTLDALRHVLTPTVAYDLIHRPTVNNDLLNFTSASGATSRITFGVENKLQTRRADAKGKLRSVDLGRLLVSTPYTFRGNGNKQGGRLGSWSVDLETYPANWIRLESDYTYESVTPDGIDNHSSYYNLDLVMVGGRKDANAKTAPGISAPVYQAFESGPKDLTSLMPQGQWYMGLGHRYSRNDKTEDVLQFDWQVTEKWQIGTFNRFTWKEVSSSSKRFNNLREYQYRLRRDLHDWFAEAVYHVDREFGEELFLTLTLKAYPEMPIGIQESYNQPKLGSQSSPFSPIRTQ